MAGYVGCLSASLRLARNFSTVRMRGSSVRPCAIFVIVSYGTPLAAESRRQEPLRACNSAINVSRMEFICRRSYAQFGFLASRTRRAYFDSVNNMAGHAQRKPEQLARVLSVNLKKAQALRKKRNEPCGNRYVGEQAGIGEGSVARAMRGDRSSSLATLEALANFYDLDPWQLLVPEFDPANPPLLRELTPELQAFYEKIQGLMAQNGAAPKK